MEQKYIGNKKEEDKFKQNVILESLMIFYISIPPK